MKVAQSFEVQILNFKKGIKFKSRNIFILKVTVSHPAAALCCTHRKPRQTVSALVHEYCQKDASLRQSPQLR